jgi:hypothetical protein
MKWMPLFLLVLAACAGRPAIPPGKEPLGIPAVLSPEVFPEIPPEIPAEIPETGPVAAEDEIFDPGSISEEVFNATKMDVQKFIRDLNRIIRAKNYEAWVDHLGEAYFSQISSPEYLSQISESARLKTRQIRINTPQDYFIHVVVPSRADDRVDDIEFVSPTRVKAFTITAKKQRLRLYDLEWSNNGWKIVN